jgi:tRNA modification GTPase
MLARHQEPIVAIATAPGRGAVGIVRVSGRGLTGLIQSLCGRQLKAREATYLPFLDQDGSAIDHGLAIHFPGPNSFTGEDVLELQAHGGPVVLQLLVTRCLQAAAEVDAATGQPHLAGLRVAQPGEFSERAFLNDKIDLAQAEAIADLIDASTEAAARSASRSLAGDFSREIHTLRDALIHLRMLVEATLDFPEEEIDFLQKADAQGQLNRLQAHLATVLQRTRQGALLREGIRVVIAGPPIAGTTRDVVQQTIQIEGVPLHVIDTAGLREGADVDTVEQIGIERAWGQIEQADAVLFLHDLTRTADKAYAASDAEIAQTLSERLPKGVPVIDIWNKADAAPSADKGSAGITLSARTGEGLQALRQRLLHEAGWQQASEGLYIARERHVQALLHVGEHLDIAQQLLAAQAQSLDLLAEELRQSQNYLNEITGEFSADDLLGVIFSSFCIGK